MKTENRNKIIILAVFTVLLTFNAAAQVSSTGPVEFLNDIAQQISDQQLLQWLEADTIWEVLIFLGVPIAAFYAMTRLIVTKGIEFAEGNFRMNTPDRITRKDDDLSDLADWSAKILSIGIAVLATVQYGGLFYNITSILALAVLLGILWVFAGGSGGLFSPLPFGTPSLPSFGNDGTDEDVEDAENRAADGQENLDEGGEDINQSEGDMQNGNMGDADREAEAAAQHIEKAIQDIEIAEEDLMDAFSRVQNQVQQTLKELEQTSEIDENQEKIIQRISKLPKEVIQFVDDVEAQVNPDMPTEQDLVNPKQVERIENLFHEAEEVNTSLNTLIEEIEEEGEKEAEEERELLTELRELIEIHKLIKQIGQEIKLGSKEDQELEKIAKKLKDTDLYNEIETEENQEKKLLDQLKQLQSQEQRIEENIKKADKIITHLITLDSEEIKQLQGEDNEYQNAAGKASQYLKTLERNDMAHYDQGVGIEMGDLVQRLYSTLQEIDEKIEAAGRLEQEDLNEAEQMKNELENLIQQLES